MSAEPVQADLFAAAAAEGRARRDVGAAAARDSAHSWWLSAAETALAQLAGTGQPFTAETLRERVGRPLASSDNTVGAVILHAARRKQIACIGYQPATRPEAHGRILRVWRGVR